MLAHFTWAVRPQLSLPLSGSTQTGTMPQIEQDRRLSVLPHQGHTLRFVAPQLIPFECNVKVYLLIKLLLLHMEISTEEELVLLQRDALIEVPSDDSCANW